MAEYTVIEKHQLVRSPFVNSGDARLRQVDIHLSPTLITEWLDPAQDAPVAGP
jgi:hypothetical protein